MLHENNTEETEINTEEIAGNGRRSTDNASVEGVFSSSGNSFRNKFYSGVFSLGVVTALLTVGISAGNFSATLDTVVKATGENKESIKDILTQNRDLIIVLKEQAIYQKVQGIHQKEYEKKILDKLDNTENKLNDINNGVRGNREAITIINLGNKVTSRDNTRVQYLASR